MPDLGLTTALMRVMLAPNLLGLPAISVPVGSVPSGTAAHQRLPVALQLIAPPWHEATLLGAAAALEAEVARASAAAASAGVSALQHPAVWFAVLGDARAAASAGAASSAALG